MIDAGDQLVSWGGLKLFTLFNQYDLSETRREMLQDIVRSHFDLKAAWYFGLTTGTEPVAPRAPIGNGRFPHKEWLSGVRSLQMAAVHFSIETLANLSQIFHSIDACYFEDGRSVSVGSLCDGAHVESTFGHARPIARRLSESLQDEVSLLL